MRRIRQFFPALCTLLLLTAGIYLPQASSLLLDRRLERTDTRRELISISLDLFQNADLFQALRLFQSRGFQVELAEYHTAGDYRMTAAEVRRAASEIFGALSPEGRIPVAPSVRPVLITDGDADGTSAVFWCCTWENSDNELWLDDRNGLLVALRARMDTKTSVVDRQEDVIDDAYVTVKEASEPIDGAVWLLREYCRKTYPVDGVWLEPMEGTDGQEYTLILERFSDGATEAQSVPIRVWGNWLYFNI